MVSDAKEALRLKLKRGVKISVISQTTQSKKNFLEVVKALSEVGAKEFRVFDTICNDAEERQKRATQLAEGVGCMIVIGGRHSANTRRLYDVCKKVCSKTFHIETASDIKSLPILAGRDVGITSGASTPDWIIRDVLCSVRSLALAQAKSKRTGKKGR